jgi:hypothetical protein
MSSVNQRRKQQQQQARASATQQQQPQPAASRSVTAAAAAVTPAAQNGKSAGNRWFQPQNSQPTEIKWFTVFNVDYPKDLIDDYYFVKNTKRTALEQGMEAAAMGLDGEGDGDGDASKRAPRKRDNYEHAAEQYIIHGQDDEASAMEEEGGDYDSQQQQQNHQQQGAAALSPNQDKIAKGKSGSIYLQFEPRLYEYNDRKDRFIPLPASTNGQNVRIRGKNIPVLEPYVVYKAELRRVRQYQQQQQQHQGSRVQYERYDIVSIQDVRVMPFTCDPGDTNLFSMFYRELGCSTEDSALYDATIKRHAQRRNASETLETTASAREEVAKELLEQSGGSTVQEALALVNSNPAAAVAKLSQSSLLRYSTSAVANNLISDESFEEALRDEGADDVLRRAKDHAFYFLYKEVVDLIEDRYDGAIRVNKARFCQNGTHAMVADLAGVLARNPFLLLLRSRRAKFCVEPLSVDELKKLERKFNAKRNRERKQQPDKAEKPGRGEDRIPLNPLLLYVVCHVLNNPPKHAAGSMFMTLEDIVIGINKLMWRQRNGRDAASFSAADLGDIDPPMWKDRLKGSEPASLLFAFAPNMYRDLIDCIAWLQATKEIVVTYNPADKAGEGADRVHVLDLEDPYALRYKQPGNMRLYRSKVWDVQRYVIEYLNAFEKRCAEDLPRHYSVQQAQRSGGGSVFASSTAARDNEKDQDQDDDEWGDCGKSDEDQERRQLETALREKIYDCERKGYIIPDCDTAVENAEKVLGITLNAEQREYVECMVDPKKPVVALLGLPGTGKTQSMLAAMLAYDKPGAVILLVTLLSKLTHSIKDRTRSSKSSEDDLLEELQEEAFDIVHDTEEDADGSNSSSSQEPAQEQPTAAPAAVPMEAADDDEADFLAGLNATIAANTGSAAKPSAAPEKQQEKQQQQKHKLFKHAKVLIYTIHMATALSLNNAKFHKLLESCHVLLVDETQNNDLATFAMNVRNARKSACLQKIGLSGDKNQIQPIGVGRPYLDLLASGKVAVVTLVENNRVASGDIVLPDHSRSSGHTGAMRDVLVENTRLLVDEHNQNALINKPDSFNAAMGLRELPAYLYHRSGPSEPMEPIMTRLRYGDGTNMQVLSYANKSEMHQHILKLFKRHRAIYREITVVSGTNAVIDEINQYLAGSLQALVLDLEPAWKNNASMAPREGADMVPIPFCKDIHVGRKIKFRKNYPAAIVPLHDEYAAKLLEHKKAKAMGMKRQTLGTEGNTVPQQQQQQKSGRHMLSVRQEVDVEEGSIVLPEFGIQDVDYVVSSGVSNGEADWVEEVRKVQGMPPSGDQKESRVVYMVKLAQSGKTVCIGEQHVDANHVSLGFANTIDSQMGSESDICVVVLDGEHDITWLDRSRLIVAMSRARKMLHVVASNYVLDQQEGQRSHPLNAKLYSREINLNRRFFYMDNLPASMILGALHLIQLIYSNKPVDRQSDMAYYVQHGTAMAIQAPEEEEDEEESESDSDSESGSGSSSSSSESGSDSEDEDDDEKRSPKRRRSSQDSATMDTSL